MSEDRSEEWVAYVLGSRFRDCNSQICRPMGGEEVMVSQLLSLTSLE